MTVSREKLFTNTDKLLISADELCGHIRALDRISAAPFLFPAHQKQIRALAVQARMQAELVSIYAAKVRRDRSSLIWIQQSEQVQPA